MIDTIKATCPYCKLSLYISDNESIYNLNRINKFLYKCDFCKNTLIGHRDGKNIKTTRITKGCENMIDKNTIIETAYGTIKDNIDGAFGSDGDKLVYFVDGVITLAEGLIEKVEKKEE